MVQYKWVALSNTTLGVLMGSINSTIILISLPAIFKGIDLNPFLGSSFQYLLWILMGYMMITAVLLVTVGRLSDMYGRVRLFNLGFLIFTIGSILLSITPNTGDLGAQELIAFRIVQAIGGSFLFANSAAIITDSFPANERGKAMGINQISALAGSLVGLILGGILSIYNWRFVFLVSVPVGVLGTVWSYSKLKDHSVRHKDQKLDIPGNISFAGGLTLILVGITYGLMPYNGNATGWGNPYVILSMIVGVGMLVSFVFIEMVVPYPMFNLSLFKIRAFSTGSFASLLQSMGMGGLMFMIIILLQGIWLPLHGYSYSSVPFWAGIYTIPMMLGFVALGPISGALSDRFGAKGLSTVGLLISAVAFVLLSTISYNFSYIPFALMLFMMGSGMGMFAAPNVTAVMNAVPPHLRGVASGMRSTMQNTGQTLSMGLFFTIIVVYLTKQLPGALTTSLSSSGAPVLIPVLTNIPPTSALFSAFLGYDPIGTILSNLGPISTLISSGAGGSGILATLEGKIWFPTTISGPFMNSLHVTFYAGALIFILGAMLSALRGNRIIYEDMGPEETGIEMEEHAPLVDPVRYPEETAPVNK